MAKKESKKSSPQTELAETRSGYQHRHDKKPPGHFDPVDSYKFKSNFWADAKSIFSFSNSILMDSLVYRSLLFPSLAMILAAMMAGLFYFVTVWQSASIVVWLLLIPIFWILLEWAHRTSKK
jgi:hypothetical protein